MGPALGVSSITAAGAAARSCRGAGAHKAALSCGNTDTVILFKCLLLWAGVAGPLCEVKPRKHERAMLSLCLMSLFVSWTTDPVFVWESSVKAAADITTDMIFCKSATHHQLRTARVWQGL